MEAVKLAVWLLTEYYDKMKIVISAVPGSGKTTVMKAVAKKVPSAKIVNVGDLIFGIAKKKLKIKNRDEMRKTLTIEQERKFQEIVAKKIAKMRNKIVLVDTHASIKTPHGYFPGLSETTMHAMKPDIIVLLEYRPKDVLQRRKDPTRKRDQETEKEIGEHQKYNREFAFAAAGHADAAVEIIDLRYRQKKPFDHVKKAASDILKLIKN